MLYLTNCLRSVTTKRVSHLFSSRSIPSRLLWRVAITVLDTANENLAQQFLSSLDDDPTIGRLIDQTMDFEFEQAQMLQKSGEDLTPEMWIMK